MNALFTSLRYTLDCVYISKVLLRKHFVLLTLALLMVFLGDIETCRALENECVRLHKDTTHHNLNNSIIYFEDKSAKRSLQEIKEDRMVSWSPVTESVPSFGFSSSAYWLKFDLCKPLTKDEKVIIEVSYPLLDSIYLFAIEDHKILYEHHSGDMFSFSQRPKYHRNFLFFLPPFSSKTTIYIRIKSESAVQVPLKLYSPPGFFKHNQESLLVQGCYFGIILAMILYNMFLFFSLKEWPYLLYVLFTISYFSFQGVLQGLFQQFIFNSVWWQNHALLFFGLISIFFANLFAVSFLNLPKKKPLLSWILCTMAISAACAAILASSLPYAHMVKFMLVLAITSSILIMSAGLQLWWTGHLPAQIFTIAWSTLLVSFILASLNKLGLLPRVFWTENIMQIGGVIEVVLLSIALGVRINEEKQQRIIVEQNLSGSLEVMVKERTLELNQVLRDLEIANHRLDKISLTDALTEVANRRAFDKNIQVEYNSAKRERTPLALIMIDVDHFKKLNDTYGHQTGDKILQKIARILSFWVNRPRDIVYRYGGEEFAIILNNTNLSGAEIVAEKMRKAIEASNFVIKGKSCSVTISAGVSVNSSKENEKQVRSLKELIEQADVHLYKAKMKGRNCIVSQVD